MLKKAWNDPVGSKIIASGILAMITVVGAYFLNLWPTIGALAIRVGKLLQSPSSMPNWGVILLGLITIPTIFIVAALVWVKLFQPVPTIDWRSYREDKFFGITWRWNYLKDGLIYQLVCFCPHCDFQIYANNYSPFHVIQNISFHCESCNRKLGEFGESAESFEDKVKRLIQQKIRNGTWIRTTETHGQ